MDPRAIDVPLSRLRARGAPVRPTLLHESPWQLRVREAKRALLTVARVAQWAVDPSRFAPAVMAAGCTEPRVRFEERVALDRDDPHKQPVFERGKRHNVRLAASAFDGLSLEAGRVFSFWRTLGPALESRGFVAGMELRGGCILPSIGGGLCLLSNALFRLALRADFVIVERHGHTLEAVPLSEGELWAADATVAFAHIDLRFVPRMGRWTLRASVTDTHLVLALEGDAEPTHDVELCNERVRVVHGNDGDVRVGALVRRRTLRANADERETELIAEDRKRVLTDRELGRNCMTCNETSCHAREEQLALIHRSNPS